MKYIRLTWKIPDMRYFSLIQPKAYPTASGPEVYFILV